ncbi:MAG: M50 family metallopeptidase [Brevundimonas sp.]|uniref:M50 family metallopeptidase n=1 Tax=Brevundimonas sp. TaxID=1871086 RepID=UPI00260B1C4C|nr:M50 family metallopeptidase [Brevundimonas sp.]MDI6624769.1 M50 family metallopeptidase [Brevundimonas sp.]MDQ7811155.1 M50 family metallopeptidase [Brevundimonas sp.]
MTGFLGQALLYIVPFLLVLTFIVTIHELGHFLVARAFGVKIDRFSIGFGKTIVSRVDRRGTEWRIAWLPLGGYVKFSGDLDPSSVPDEAGLAELRQRVIVENGPGAERDYFHFKPIWQRALIVAAGPAANFVLAMVLFTLLFTAVGEQVLAPRVARVDPGTPAAAAGFQPNDLIKAIDGRPVADTSDVTRTVMMSAGDSLRFTVDRNGRETVLVATPQRRLEDDQIAGRVRIARIGLLMDRRIEDFSFRRLNPVQAFGKGIETIGTTVGTTATYIGRIFAGKESGDLLNGPIGIAKAAGGVTQQAVAANPDPGWMAANLALTFLSFAALVSIGIGIVNLLPIPVLDGGHLLFYGYEAVARRPVPARVQEVGYRVGLALLAGLMLFATWNDLQKLSLFKFLGGLA